MIKILKMNPWHFVEARKGELPHHPRPHVWAVQDAGGHQVLDQGVHVHPGLLQHRPGWWVDSLYQLMSCRTVKLQPPENCHYLWASKCALIGILSWKALYFSFQWTMLRATVQFYILTWFWQFANWKWLKSTIEYLSLGCLLVNSAILRVLNNKLYFSTNASAHESRQNEIP